MSDQQSQSSDQTLQPNINALYEVKHRTSVSSLSSGSSVCDPPSPYISTLRRQSSALTCPPPSEMDEESGDEPWNLVAYHIPWGPGYEGYEAGTLPGPDGTCIFLRSPTPLKRQRTVQACDKCRERKAKPAFAAPAPIESVVPIVSMLQSQLHIEKGQSDMNVLRHPHDEATSEIDTKELNDNAYNLSREPLNLYTRSIVNLDAYKFPPACIENTHDPEMNLTSPSVNLDPMYHVNNGLTIQMASSVPPETLWQIPDYYSQLELKPTHHVFTNLDIFQPVYVDGNYTSISPHRSIDVRVPEPVSEESLGGTSLLCTIKV
ncbi:hypothetical protein Clacol_005084 [Clathrus columnatus]|uniref:Uncharacterized protein n=1 Tax=Clathrus columnatus TaxID=1419009 RepID=A0AAV5ACW9_9AGAM|nr:hypothetical protein Clacol_005084 [Clathrus columnatus]